VTHSPSLSSASRKKGLEVGNAEPFQLVHTGSRVLPVFPDDGSQAAPDPIVNGPETGGHLGVLEVIPPTSGVGI